MAENNTTVKTSGLIDPVYEEFTEHVMGTLRSAEFYNYFMESLSKGERSFQFSNRKLEKKIDAAWVEAVENCMSAFQNIIMNPRNFIVEKEEIVNVAVARQATPEVLRHLTTHGKYIDDITKDNVRPNHLLNKFKEDSWNTYENRFTYTLLEKTTDFVSKRFEAIFNNMGDEFGAFLKVDANAKNETDTIATHMDIRIRQNEDYLQDDAESESLFSRISKLNEQLKSFNDSQFAKMMIKYPRVKNPIVKTNAIQKNPNFKACYKLWVFLYNYHDVGYEINVYEQNSEITPTFEQDIYNSIFVNYLILKNYLAKEEDRLIDTKRRFKKRVLKPRYVKKIIEEIVGNFDVTDVEIRKVLIEEFTRAQLEQLEAKERRELVEDRERRQKEERRKTAAELKEMERKKQIERAERIRQMEEEKERQEERERQRKENIEALVENYIIEDLDNFIREKESVLEKREKERQEAANAGSLNGGEVKEIDKMICEAAMLELAEELEEKAGEADADEKSAEAVAGEEAADVEATESEPDVKRVAEDAGMEAETVGNSESDGESSGEAGTGNARKDVGGSETGEEAEDEDIGRDDLESSALDAQSLDGEKLNNDSSNNGSSNDDILNDDGSEKDDLNDDISDEEDEKIWDDEEEDETLEDRLGIAESLRNVFRWIRGE